MRQYTLTVIIGPVDIVVEAWSRASVRADVIMNDVILATTAVGGGRSE